MKRIIMALAVLWIVGSLSSVANAVPINQDLAGYWKFDGDGTDSSDGARDLDLFGGVGFGTGLFGQALDLNGNSSQFARRPVDDPIYDFGSGDFTAQLWVNFNSLAGEQVLLEKFQGGTGPGWTLTKLNNNSVHFFSRPSAELTGGSISTTGNFHHLIVRKSGISFNLFLNDSLIVSGANSNSIPDTSRFLLVGRREPSAFSVNGRIDEVAIWTRALSDSEISTLYNSGSGMEITVVPEPTTIVLLGIGLAGLGGSYLRRRRKKIADPPERRSRAGC